MNIFTKVKKQNGAVSVLVIVTILTFFLILTGIYFTITAMQKAQLKSDIHIQEVYRQDVDNKDDVYAELLSKQSQGLKVGSIVSYSPSGTYSWNNEYASADQTGSTTLSSASGQSFAINEWKVLSINGSTVEMVPTAQTTGTVRLQGAQGYNNCVKLLNDACSSLYSNSSKGITARSINMDDIEKIIINKGGYDPTTYRYGDSYPYYGSQTGSAYSKGNSYYPTIYGQEKNRVINGSKSSSGLGLSEQTSLISRTASSATNGYLQASTSIQPYQTYYYLNSTDFSKYLGEYKDIIVPSSADYWVASRCVNTRSDYCYFSVRSVNGGRLYNYGMFDSSIDTYSGSRAVFPVVSLSSELISGNEVDGFRVN